MLMVYASTMGTALLFRKSFFHLKQSGIKKRVLSHGLHTPCDAVIVSMGKFDCANPPLGIPFYYRSAIISPSGEPLIFGFFSLIFKLYCFFKMSPSFENIDTYHLRFLHPGNFVNLYRLLY
jgi:hypothetical protein